MQRINDLPNGRKISVTVRREPSWVGYKLIECVFPQAGVDVWCAIIRRCHSCPAPAAMLQECYLIGRFRGIYLCALLGPAYQGSITCTFGTTLTAKATTKCSGRPGQFGQQEKGIHVLSSTVFGCQMFCTHTSKMHSIAPSWTAYQPKTDLPPTQPGYLICHDCRCQLVA